MSQETRRRIAVRKQLHATTEEQVPERLRIRRFSEGLEGAVIDRLRVHVGRFSDGIQRMPEPSGDPDHIGRFSRGQDHLHGTEAEAIWVGRFDDVEPPHPT